MRGQKRVEDARERAYARASIKKIRSQCMSVLNGISASGEFGLLPFPTKPRLVGVWSLLNLPEAGKPAAGWGGVGGGGPSLGRDSNITARPPPRALTRATLPTRGRVGPSVRCWIASSTTCSTTADGSVSTV